MTLNYTQLNYSTTKKEIVIVMFELEKFLIGYKIIVLTDYTTLKYLFIKKNVKVRLIRWMLFL